MLPESKMDPSEIPEVYRRLQAVLRTLKPGDPVAIRHTQGGLLVFVITEVVGVVKGRIETKDASFYGFNRWYAKSGKNCMNPKGQSSLVEATPEVRAWAAEHGSLGTSRYKTRYHPDVSGRRIFG